MYNQNTERLYLDGPMTAKEYQKDRTRKTLLIELSL